MPIIAKEQPVPGQCYQCFPQLSGCEFCDFTGRICVKCNNTKWLLGENGGAVRCYCVIRKDIIRRSEHITSVFGKPPENLWERQEIALTTWNAEKSTGKKGLWLFGKTRHGKSALASYMLCRSKSNILAVAGANMKSLLRDEENRERKINLSSYKVVAIDDISQLDYSDKTTAFFEVVNKFMVRACNDQTIFLLVTANISFLEFGERFPQAAPLVRRIKEKCLAVEL